MLESPSKHIFFLRPQYVLPLEHFSGAYSTPPLGMAYLVGTLRKAGHKVTPLDAVGEDLNRFHEFRKNKTTLSIVGLTNDEIIERIPKDVDIIAISLMFSNEWIHHKHLIKEITKKYPDKKVVLGGEHITAEYQRVLEECPNVYACALGEGEETILEIAKGLSRKETMGIAFLENGQVNLNPRRPRIKNISELSWPDWDGIPLENYLEKKLGYNSPQGKRAVPMLASRGCPYQCTFCSNNAMWTTRWVPREVDELIEEIKFNYKTYQMDHVDFHDLTAIVNKKWILEFSEKMIKENLPLTWSMPAGTRSEALTEDVLELVFKSGCKRMTYAPESGSEETLKRMKKRVDLSKMKRSIKAALKIGFNVKVHMIMGSPQQTKKEVLESFIFLFKMALLGVHDASCFAYSPYPGTEDFTYLKEKGLIKIDEEYDEILANNVYNSFKNIKSWSEDIPKELLIFTTLGGSAFFYFFQFLFRPHRIFIVFYRIFNNKCFTTFELALSSFLFGFMRTRKKSIQEKTA
jgi:radical SAM superfamily enzyme YgiQ (UPF0313 family)